MSSNQITKVVELVLKYLLYTMAAVPHALCSLQMYGFMLSKVNLCLSLFTLLC